jgi:hypothetical protein
MPLRITPSADAFTRHGIEVLSASSLNQWVAQPALWVMERLLRHRSPTSAVFARGLAAERGIHEGLIEPSRSIEDCAAVAIAEYDRQMALVPDPKRDDERARLEGYVTNALEELRQYGIPTAYQERVEIRLDDVPVPIVGYPDWEFGEHGLIVDLKTTDRLPSAISEAHGRQGAVYARARGNFGMRFAYTRPTVPKKDGRAVVVYELDRVEVDRHLEVLRQVALRLGRFLGLSADPHELAGLLVPDFEHFWWSNAVTRAHGRQVFGF